MDPDDLAQIRQFGQLYARLQQLRAVVLGAAGEDPRRPSQPNRNGSNVIFDGGMGNGMIRIQFGPPAPGMGFGGSGGGFGGGGFGGSGGGGGFGGGYGAMGGLGGTGQVQDLSEVIESFMIMRAIAQSLEEASTTPASPPLSADAEKLLKKFKLQPDLYTKLATEKGRPEFTRDCVVCQEEMSWGCECVELPCLHFFCEGCIMPWLRKSRSCPICRREVLAAGDNSGASNRGSSTPRTQPPPPPAPSGYHPRTPTPPIRSGRPLPFESFSRPEPPTTVVPVTFSAPRPEPQRTEPPSRFHYDRSRLIDEDDDYDTPPRTPPQATTAAQSRLASRMRDTLANARSYDSRPSPPSTPPSPPMATLSRPYAVPRVGVTQSLNATAQSRTGSSVVPVPSATASRSMSNGPVEGARSRIAESRDSSNAILNAYASARAPTSDQLDEDLSWMRGNQPTSNNAGLRASRTLRPVSPAEPPAPAPMRAVEDRTRPTVRYQSDSASRSLDLSNPSVGGRTGIPSSNSLPPRATAEPNLASTTNSNRRAEQPSEPSLGASASTSNSSLYSTNRPPQPTVSVPRTTTTLSDSDREIVQRLTGPPRVSGNSQSTTTVSRTASNPPAATATSGAARRPMPGPTTTTASSSTMHTAGTSTNATVSSNRPRGNGQDGQLAASSSTVPRGTPSPVMAPGRIRPAPSSRAPTVGANRTASSHQ